MKPFDATPPVRDFDVLASSMFSNSNPRSIQSYIEGMSVMIHVMR